MQMKMSTLAKKSFTTLTQISKASVALGHRTLSNEDLDPIGIESRPQPPFWLKPKQMERTVFAEPLNAQVNRVWSFVV
jgi:hypothetical protein